MFLDKALIMCEMVYTSTYRSAWVECAGAIKVKCDIENSKRINEGRMEGYNPH